MSPLQLARSLAARFGIHAVRMSSLPSTSMMGLTNKPVDLVLDVGANRGQFARQARRLFPGARIVSFEPNPTEFRYAKQWADADGNALAFNVAVGDAEGLLEMHIHSDHAASSSLLATTAHKSDVFPATRNQSMLSVPVRRLDDILAEAGVHAGPNTLLKLDIQGFEERAMRGAPQTLSRVGALLTEVLLENLYEGQADFLTLASLARDGGLRYAGNYDQVVGQEGQVMWLDAMFLR